MTRWAWFLAGTTVVVLLTVVFAILTARAIRSRQTEVDPELWGDPRAMLGVSRRSLYLNAAASQGLLLVAMLATIILAGVAMSDLYLPGELSIPMAVMVGLLVGVVLAVVNLGMQGLLDLLGISYDDSLRELLTPTSRGEWILLLVVVLPVVAVFEELLFRGALIGGVAAGYELSPWILAVLSSVVFAAGHGLQGRGGLFAAFVLGLALAVVFVLTESLIVVIVAHYVVNTLEFARYR